MYNQASELSYERLWTHARLLMLTADFDGTIVDTNPAWSEILGWRSEDIRGWNFFDLVHPEDLALTQLETLAMKNGKQVPQFENRYRMASGVYREIDWTAVSDGRFIHAIGRDQTQEKSRAQALAQAEEALRQSQKLEAIGQLTGGIAHDFNNLLTVITGSVELLGKQNLTESKRERYITAISDAAARASKLTNQLLAFARRQTLTPELFDLSLDVSAVLSMIGSLTGARVQVRLEAPTEPIFVLADRSQLDTAIINLAVNARDAMDGNGQITISISAVESIPELRSHDAIPGDFVALTVADTGAGISPEFLERIFEPFFTTKPVGTGTGLGLSQVIGFAKQSGGDIGVESQLGQGTSFTLYLPRAFSTNYAEAIGADLEAPMVGRGLCVLVVEDNPEVGQFVADALDELGYNSHLVTNAEEALRLIDKSSSSFQIVFSDVVMPGIGGIELARTVHERHQSIPVVLTSGYSSVLANSGQRGIEILKKPFSMEELSRVLRRAVARAQSEAFR